LLQSASVSSQGCSFLKYFKNPQRVPISYNNNHTDVSVELIIRREYSPKRWSNYFVAVELNHRTRGAIKSEYTVGTDKIARTAHGALNLISSNREITV